MFKSQTKVKHISNSLKEKGVIAFLPLSNSPSKFLFGLGLSILQYLQCRVSVDRFIISGLEAPEQKELF